MEFALTKMHYSVKKNPLFSTLYKICQKCYISPPLNILKIFDIQQCPKDA